MDIREVLNLPELLDVKSVLCIEPHPDDNEVGAGGTVRKLVDRGCQVDFVTVTDGGAGWWEPGLKREDVIQTRQQERQKAAEILGVHKYYNLGFEDGGSYSEEDVAERLIPLLRELKPEVVMTVDPWTPYEAHPDHIKTGRAAARALLFCNNPAFMQNAGEPWSVPQVAFYATSYPNTFIDVTETWQRKTDAMLAHASQFANDDWPFLSQYLQYQAVQLYAQSQQTGAEAGAQSQAESQSETGSQVGSQSETGPQSESQASARLAEAFKLLSTRQLHFFPAAIYS